MQVLKYEVIFEKKSAKIKDQKLNEFTCEILKNFGGLSLLSNIKISSSLNNRIELSVEDESVNLVHTALIMCGRWNSINCCFRSYKPLNV